MKRFSVWPTSVVMLGLVCASLVIDRTAVAQQAELAKIIASDGAHYDWFGRSVAISGDTAIVGSPYSDHGGALGAGAAYVFVLTGSSWVQQQKLVALDAASDDRFGSVSYTHLTLPTSDLV